MICSRCGKAGHTSCLSTPAHVDHWTKRSRCQFCGAGDDVLVIDYPPGVGQPMCGWCRAVASLPGATEVRVDRAIDARFRRIMTRVIRVIHEDVAAAIERAEAAARAPR